MSTQPPAGVPTVSVIIPAYNAVQFLSEAIDSALGQTFPVKEIIVVDDGSTDDYSSVLTRFNHGVHYRRIQNGGPARARNVGLAAATGDLVAFLDADDVWLPDKIAKQVARLLALEHCALVYCGKTIIDTVGADLGLFSQIEFPEGDIVRAMLLENHISSSSAVVARREVLLTLGGFNERKDLMISEDYELWMRVASRFPVASVPEPLLRYRIHGSNITGNCEQRYIAKLTALDLVEADLKAQGKLTTELGGVLTRTRLTLHEQSALAFLYRGNYSRARGAARSFAVRRGRKPMLFLALRWLPDWVLQTGHQVRRLIRQRPARQR